MSEQIHGTCVDLSGAGVLLRGPSGSGKSDLALRLIDGGASLVADDRVDLEVRDGTLSASAPAKLAGLIELRGMGIMRLPCLPRTTIRLVIDLVDEAAVERLPEPLACSVLGIKSLLIRLSPWSASAAAKVRLAVDAARQPSRLVAVL